MSVRAASTAGTTSVAHAKKMCKITCHGGPQQVTLAVSSQLLSRCDLSMPTVTLSERLLGRGGQSSMSSPSTHPGRTDGGKPSLYPRKACSGRNVRRPVKKYPHALEQKPRRRAAEAAIRITTVGQLMASPSSVWRSTMAVSMPWFERTSTTRTPSTIRNLARVQK